MAGDGWRGPGRGCGSGGAGYDNGKSEDADGKFHCRLPLVDLIEQEHSSCTHKS